MYQNIFFDRNTYKIHLWDDELGYASFPYKKYAYILDSKGDHLTIFDQKVRQIYKWTDEMVDKLFEADISPEMRTLVDLYHEQPDNIYPKHRTVTFDIEVDSQYKLPDVMKADNKVTGIALYYHEEKSYYSLILDEVGRLDTSKINKVRGDGSTVDIVSCKTEEELLKKFIHKIEDIRPTILTGWNIDFFDIPYLMKRIENILGKAFVTRLSPVRIVQFSEFRRRFFIAGVAVLDYLSLYKKFTFNQETSYRLDIIAQKEVGKGKTKFEGSLQDLFKNDPEKFVEYNLNDVELVVEIDNKRKILDLVVGISHKGKIPYEDIYYSSRYLEGAILSYLKSKKLICPNKPNNQLSSRESFVGAYVKDPIKGLYKWVFDLDLTSLYPSIIMSLNISPETKIGKILDWSEHDFAHRIDRNWTIYNFKHDQEVSLTTVEFIQMLESSKHHVSSNGIIYINKDIKEGVIPTILSNWFDERTKYKNMMKKYGKEKNTVKYEFYDKLQNIQKVLLNSLYGVLGLPIFRFYDVDNAAAVTTTGQTIIKFSERVGNEFFQSKTGVEKDYCIYIDTDSLFFSAEPLLKLDKKYESYTDVERLDKILKITGAVQKYINSTYDDFAVKYLNIHGKHKFTIKQELICKSGLWTTKKRYALWVINREGIAEDKLKVTGLDTVRSSFPAAFKGFMEKLLTDILNSVDKSIINENILKLEKQLESVRIQDISKITSIQQISKYENVKDNVYYTNNMFSNIKKGTPAHVIAAISFNDLLRYYKLDKTIPTISDGEKIRWCYLKKNEFYLEKLAFRGYDDPPRIIEIIEKYVDRHKMYEQELRGKIENIYEAINWKFPVKESLLAKKFFG